MTSNSKIIKYKDKRGNTYPYLFIDERSGVFQAKKRVGERILVASLETTDFNKARAMVLDKINEISKRPSDEPKKNLIFKDFYEMMIEEKRIQEIKEITIGRIDTIWRLSLEPYWSYVFPEDINQQMINDFITWHKRKRPGVQFVNVFKYLGNVINVMAERGAISLSDRPNLDLPKEEQKHHDKEKGRYIEDPEIKEILKKSDQTTWLLVMIAYCTGMRKMEIGSLELSRVTKVGKRFIFKLDTDDTKTGMAREIPLPESLTQAIQNQIKPKADHLFPMKSNLKRFTSSQLIDKGWNLAKAGAKIHKQTRFHDMRHTAATNFAKSGINPIIACTILGMSFSTYQKRYLKLKAEDLIIASEANADRLGKTEWVQSDD